MRAAGVCALLVLACAGPPTREAALGPAQASAFVEAFERAIAARDWDAVRGAFLPNAFVLYQEATQDSPKRLPPEQWVGSLASLAGETDFTRRREVWSIERSEAGRIIVKSRLVETLLGEAGLLEVVSDEMMTVAQRDGATGILALALWIGSAHVEDVEWL